MQDDNAAICGRLRRRMWLRCAGFLIAAALTVGLLAGQPSAASRGTPAATFSIATEPTKIDFLWVIQNSGSIADDHLVLFSAAQTFVDQLPATGIDWRVAVAYTDSDRPLLASTCAGAPGPGTGVIAPLTTDPLRFLNGGSDAGYVRAGSCGSGTERGFAGAQAAIGAFLSGTACLPGGDCSLRPDAHLSIIFFTDTGEQTTAPPLGQPDSSPTSWVSYFRDYDPFTPGAQTALVNGFLCPFLPVAGQPACSDNLVDPTLFQRYTAVIDQLGGVRGTALDADEAPRTIADILSAAQHCADVTPPSLSVSVSPITLFPPNHKYVTVNATATATDAVDAGPVVSLVSVVSSEPENAPGGADGNTTSDVVIVDENTFRLGRNGTRTEAGVATPFRTEQPMTATTQRLHPQR